MILTCPSCATRYQADSARFTSPGLNVRCAKCSHIWFHPVPEVEAEPETDHTIIVEPVAPPQGPFPAGAVTPERDAGIAAPPAIPKVRRNWGAGIARAAAWALLLACVLGAAWAVVSFRQEIAERWPQTSSFYAAIGTPVNVRGLAFQDVAYTQEFEEGQPVLSITGKVVNVTRRELPVPELRISLSNAEKHELYRWNLDVGTATLKPGEAKNFVTRLTSPPPDARSVDVRFMQTNETP